MYYYDTPNYSVALNAKVGSSSMARAIIRQFQPKQDWLIRTAAFPAGVTAEDRQWHWMAKGVRTPDKPVVLLVRDPVDRFISAMQQIGLKRKDVAQAIASLVNDTPITRERPTGPNAERAAARIARRRERRTKRNPNLPQQRAGHLRDDIHFRHQHLYAVGPTICFRFPQHLAEAAALIGFKGPMPRSNEAKREKPTLTAAQAAAVRAYYATDQALFDAIMHPGYIFTSVAQSSESLPTQLRDGLLTAWVGLNPET
jgi:hypothetical protein